MFSLYKALIKKEWIKTKLYLILLALITVLALFSAFLELNGIYKTYGSFSLFMTLIHKQPIFFNSFKIIFAAGILLAGVQTRLDSSGKKLRLMYHLPIAPEHSIFVLMGYGLSIIMAINIILFTGLYAIMLFFKLPCDLYIPILKTITPWLILNLAVYIASTAFFASSRLGIKAFMALWGYSMFRLMVNIDQFQANNEAIIQFAGIVIISSALVFYSFLDFKSHSENRNSYKFSKKITLILITLAFFTTMPRFYWKIFSPKKVKQFISYTSIEDDFIIRRVYPEQRNDGQRGKKTTYTLAHKNKNISLSQQKALQPVLYSADLAKNNKLPCIEIEGKCLSQKELSRGWVKNRFIPQGIDEPEPMLHMLIESEPQGAKFNLPDDLFRLTEKKDKIEFITPGIKGVKKEKSRIYTNALKEKGFKFPVIAIASNPDIKKKYDNGFLLVDSNNILFNLKMKKSKPWCVNTGVKIPGNVKKVIVAEPRFKKFMATIFTDKDVFIVESKGYKLFKLPLSGVDLKYSSISYFMDISGSGTIIAKNYRNLAENAESKVFGLKNNYSEIKEFTLNQWPGNKEKISRLNKVEAFIFPFTIVSYSIDSFFNRVRIVPPAYITYSLSASVLSLILLLLISRKEKFNLFNSTFVFLTGPIGLFILLIVNTRGSFKGMRI